MHDLGKITALVLILTLLAGCSVIDEEQTRNKAQDITDSDEQETPEYIDHQSLFFPVTRRLFSVTLPIEELTTFAPEFEEDERLRFEVSVPTPQHYSITLSAAGNAVVTLTADGEQQGAFYINSAEFTEETLDGIYLASGGNNISLTVLKGAVTLDSVTVGDFEPDPSRFEVSRVPANPNASAAVRLFMDYLGEIYGKRILLAQHVTPGTNSEIGAIFETTRRFPAIRVSDFMRYSRSFTGDKPANDDVTLAIEWANTGGIVSYGWTWHAPPINGGRSHYYAGATDFNLDSAFTAADIAVLDIGRLEALYHSGAISESTLELIHELDHIAEYLKRLQAENIPVLWRPLHQARTGWFWWGNCLPESYIWLWRLMFERFGSYHALDNLIWVWAGQSAAFYPGDGYVDVIGEDIYNMDDASNMPQFVRTADYPERARLTAMTECGLLPSADLLGRDGAFWLWTALYRGDFLVDHRGRHNSLFNQRERLERAYNHELTITLDKLPESF